MTKDDRALLRDMLHKLECHYPSMNPYPLYMEPYTHEEATAHNAEREQLLKAARKLVTKLCRKPKARIKPRDPRLGDHFV